MFPPMLLMMGKEMVGKRRRYCQKINVTFEVFFYSGETDEKKRV